jgi:hypothetical protein
MEGEDDLLQAAGPVQILDALPDVKPLVEHGVARLSQTLLSVVSAQIQSTTADLSHFQLANETAVTEYGKLLTAVTPVAQTFTEVSTEHKSLAPYLETVTALEAAVSELEGVATQLSSQVKQLEAAFQGVMQL